MSRPESPLKGNMSDEEMNKKLKGMIFKEKRINKENSKLIGDLNNQLELKSLENHQLISQIQRLSEFESSNLDEVHLLKKENSNLSQQIVELNNRIEEQTKEIQISNEKLNLIHEKLTQQSITEIDSIFHNKQSEELENRHHYELINEENSKLTAKILELNEKTERISQENVSLRTEIEEFKTEFCRQFDEINLKLNRNYSLKKTDNFSRFSMNNFDLIESILNDLQNQIDSNGLIQDGFDRMTTKCDELESVIECQREKLGSIQSNESIITEIEQKDEKIKRLEELIEDNRNISRALETERDQLQNDLVDLRQRHEEKEGYLMEEYREAKQNLESYRKINDKESADKTNEIENLKTQLNEYQRELNDDCRFCQEIIGNCKNRFGIIVDNSRRENLVEIFTKKIDENQNLRRTINEIKEIFGLDSCGDGDENEYQLKIVNFIKKSIIDNENYVKKIDEYQIKIENINHEKNHILTENESLRNRLKGTEENSIKIFEKLSNFESKMKILFNIKTDNFQLEQIIDYIEEIMNEKKDLVEKIDNFKDKESEELKEKLSIFEKQKLTFEEIKSNLLKENSNLNEIINEIRNIFNIKSDNSEIIIDFIKQSINEKEKQLEKIEENPSKIDNYNEKEIDLLKENSNLNEIINEIKNIFDIKSDNFDLIKQLINEKENLMKKIENQSKFDNYNEKEIDLLKENENLKEKISNFEREFLKIDQIKSNLLKENSNFNEIINEIKNIFDIKSDNSEIIIDFIKQSINEKEKQLEKIEENQSKIDNYNEKEIDLLKENSNLKEKISNFENKLQYILDIKTDNFQLEIIIDYIKQLINEKEALITNFEENQSKIDNLLKEYEELKEKLSIFEKDNSNFNEILNEIKTIFDIKSDNSQLEIIIDYIKQIMIDKENLLEIIEENQSKIDNYNQEQNDILTNNKELKEKLSIFEKQFSGNDLINLEMAEFDKTLVNLNNQLITKTSKIEDLESALKSKEGLIELFQQQLSEKETHSQFLEERCSKMKQLLVKTKRELADSRKELEQLRIANGTNYERLESFTNQLEETKFLLSEALKEKEKITEHHSVITKKMENLSKNKDQRLSDLRNQLDLAINNNQVLQREFDSYKIKAQNALTTQQRPKSTFSNFMTTAASESTSFNDTDKEELKKSIMNLEVAMKDLKIDLQESEDKNFTLSNELDSLRWENEKWIEKYKLLALENNELHLKYQKIVEESQETDKIQRNSYSNLIEKFEIEKENITKSYISQIESNKLNYENQISNLEQRLMEIENEKVKYQEEIWECREQLKNMECKYNQPNFAPDNQNPSIKCQTWSNNLKNPLDQERQQGEGMENTSEIDEADNLNSQYFSPPVVMKSRSYNNSMIPLDKLINSGTDKESVFNDEQLTQMISQTQSYKKKIEHLTELLNDSEATAARLTEQAIILKSEIRRLEKNNERDTKLTDEPTHEYLKNVIMKFLDADTKLDERSQLVPVLVTLLSLDLNEKEKLVMFSKSIQIDKRQMTDGWSGYFNWTGVS